MTPVCHLPDGTAAAEVPPPALVLPGSFNPLHAGHRGLAAAASRRFGAAVHYELSVCNVDKPDLPAEELARRVGQFRAVAPVWVTRAATFAAKAAAFPGATFVLGWDTAVRLVDPRYYGHDPARSDVAFRTLRDHGCRVLVAGRLDAAGVFRLWDHAGVGAEFRDLFTTIPEAEFRVDLSSTLLRAGR